MIDFPTHERGNILDLILTNIPERICDIDNLGNFSNSDHAMIMVHVNFKQIAETRDKTFLDWNKVNKSDFTNFLDSVDWISEAEEKDVEGLWNFFVNTLHKGISRFVPVQQATSKRLPWSNPNLTRLINIKQRRWKNHVTGLHNDISHAAYKKAQRTASRAVRKAKRNYEKKLANSGNQKKFYSYIKSKTKSKTGIGPIKVDNVALTNDNDTANALNEFFASVFTCEDLENIPKPEIIECETTLEDVKFTFDSIKKKISALKPSSAPGPDNISARVLKEFDDSLVTPLKLIFEKSMNESTVPKAWKNANVTAIHKKSSKSLVSNYRPISLTSIPCKIMESIIKDCIMDHYGKNNLINQSQHGFMPKKSCLSNLLLFQEAITSDIDAGQPSDVVYLDFSKAFDLVPKERLLRKLSAHSVRGKLLEWSRDWLTDRRQRVVLNGTESAWMDVLSGVPQGSVLGPLFFITYINDLDSSAADADLVLKFADDTKIIHNVSTEDKSKNLQLCLHKLYDWSLKWGMRFNLDKCVTLHTGRNNPTNQYTMNNQPLPKVTFEKDLGVITSANLKPSEQCLKAVKTANRVLGQLTRSFLLRDRHAYLNLYKQHVRCHLEYCIPAWRPWNLGDIEAMERVQKRAVRQIEGLKGKTYEEKLLEIGLESLESRRDR